MQAIKSTLSLRRYYLENFLMVYEELLLKLREGHSPNQYELASYLEELQDYAEKAEIEQEFVDKLIKLKERCCEIR